MTTRNSRMPEAGANLGASGGASLMGVAKPGGSGSFRRSLTGDAVSFLKGALGRRGSSWARSDIVLHF